MEETAVIAEQLKHAMDVVGAKLDRIELEPLAAARDKRQHIRELVERRLDKVEEDQDDHESRLRDVQDGVTQLKTWSGLAIPYREQGSRAGLVSLAALLKSFWGS